MKDRKKKSSTTSDTHFVYFDKRSGNQANVFRGLNRFQGLRKTHFPQSADFDFLQHVNRTSMNFFFLKTNLTKNKIT